MALYVSAGRRRRRIYLASGLSAAIALLIGLGVGRYTAPTPADKAKEAKSAAKVVTGQLQAFPIHYEQVTKGELDRAGFYQSLDAGLKRADTDLGSAMQAAAWLDAATKVNLQDGLRNIRAVADRNAPASEFSAAVQREVTQIDTAFGAPSSTPP